VRHEGGAEDDGQESRVCHLWLLLFAESDAPTEPQGQTPCTSATSGEKRMVVKQSTILVLSLFAASSAFAAAAAKDEPQTLAEKYLKALSDPKQQSGKDHLLGGVSLDAKSAVVYSPKIVSRGETRVEEGAVGDLAAAVDALDKAGLALLEDSSMLGGVSDPKAGVDVEKARKMAEKTKQLRKDLMSKYPVFADVIRADRTLYWHPKNPARLLLQKAQKSGSYKVEYIAFTVESKDGPKEKPHAWPLRVVRMKTEGADTGWKILPASEWDPE